MIAYLLLTYAAFGAEPPLPQPQPATTEVLELRRALFESQIQNLAYAINAIDAELDRRDPSRIEKRKAAEKPVEKKAETK
jgi:hypothetical protein